jgi:ligand-binding SRPBCC domain-containing protein
MHTVSATRTIDAPIADVWNAIDDFGNVYRFHPKVEHSRSLDDVAAGEGAKRQCDFYGGGSIREEVVESVSQKKQVVDIFDNGPFPLKRNVARFDLDPVEDDRTDVTMTISFVPKYGPAGWLMAKLVMEGQFRDLLEDLLAGLDTYLRTGEVVGPDGQAVETTSSAGTSAA